MSKRIPQISIYKSKIQIEIKTLESSFLLESSLFDRTAAIGPQEE